MGFKVGILSKGSRWEEGISIICTRGAYVCSCNWVVGAPSHEGGSDVAND